MTQRRAYLLIATLASLLSAMLFVLAWQRYASFHNRTFDLAFYTRIAWGLARFKLFDSIVGGHVLGLHLSVVLLPLGWLGAVFGTVRVLLVTQTLAYALTVFPLARMGERRFGPWGALLAAVLWLLYPNLGHVFAFEFHPGTLAVVPLAYLVDALDRRDAKHFFWSVLGVLACREDLALVTAIAGILAMRLGDRDSDSALRGMGKKIFIASLLYFALFAFVLHPIFAPPRGSMVLHFGAWGKTVPEAAWYLVRHPLALVTHFGTPQRLFYLPRILLPLGLFVPLFGWRYLLPVLPVIAINVFSQFPTTTYLDSHYLTPAVPFLVAASLEGASRLLKSHRASLTLALPVIVAHILAGGTWLSQDCPLKAFADDDESRALRAIASRIPEGVSVQAPDALLPHLAEREFVYRAPPPEHRVAYTVLDVHHRQRLLHRGDVLRATEEPFVRDWLARSTQEVLYAEGPFILTRRAAASRTGILARYFRAAGASGNEVFLSVCLSVQGARINGDNVEIDLVAHGGCDSDLGLRIGAEPKPRRIDLLFDGLLAPTHLRAGDRLRSSHPLTASELRGVRTNGLYLGLVRQSEARPVPTDPDSVRIPLN